MVSVTRSIRRGAAANDTPHARVRGSRAAGTSFSLNTRQPSRRTSGRVESSSERRAAGARLTPGTEAATTPPVSAWSARWLSSDKDKEQTRGKPSERSAPHSRSTLQEPRHEPAKLHEDRRRGRGGHRYHGRHGTVCRTGRGRCSAPGVAAAGPWAGRRVLSLLPCARSCFV